MGVLQGSTEDIVSSFASNYRQQKAYKPKFVNRNPGQACTTYAQLIT